MAQASAVEGQRQMLDGPIMTDHIPLICINLHGDFPVNNTGPALRPAP
jgi:hypothetical protein